MLDNSFWVDLNTRFTHALLIAIIMHLWRDTLGGYGGFLVVAFCGAWAIFYPQLRKTVAGRRT